jgi:hypothetical protein
VQNPSTSNPGAPSLSAAASAIFRQAASDGRDSLNARELGALLSSLAINFREQSSTAKRSPVVELRISLNNTREFGMVISAGLGGLDAGLDKSYFSKDRASVHAATELADAEDFLGLFKRTLVYEELTGAAKRDKLPLPDAQLKACFERILALASCYSPGNSKAPFVLRDLELNPVQIGNELAVRAAQ